VLRDTRGVESCVWYDGCATRRDDEPLDVNDRRQTKVGHWRMFSRVISPFGPELEWTRGDAAS